MNRWPVERTWVVSGDDGSRREVKSAHLASYRACSILGAAGLGKSYELAILAETDRARGLDVREKRLAVLAQTPDGLRSRLETLSSKATEETAIYLDALDEVMVPVKIAGLVLASWIRENLRTARPTIRLSCRSTVWPPEVGNAFREVYGKEEFAAATLQPLSLEEVSAVVAAHGIDPGTFVAAIERSGATVLSQQPLTLIMLLRIYSAGGSLPSSRSSLFSRAVELLASEREERRGLGTAPDVPTATILEAAERLACFSLLSGREVVDLGDWPPPSVLGFQELSSLPGGSRPLDHDLLQVVGRSALCDGDGPHRFRFAHRQIAEYLAGRRLSQLQPHQAKALLASGLGWRQGVAGPLRETAAFAAMESPPLAEWVADHDPEVVGLSDVADDALRRRATLNLLAKFRSHELTDAQFWHDGGVVLTGLRYDGAEPDLRNVFRELGPDCEDVVECAVKLIDAWELTSMSHDLADLMLDPSVPLHARKSAGYALARFGTWEARRRLKPLITGWEEDRDDDLKGLALRCNWPDGLTIPELLESIKHPRAGHYLGAYAAFLSALDHDGIDLHGHLLVGLAWARQFVCDDRDHEATVRIAKRIARSAVDNIEEEGVAEALAELVLAAASAHAESPLVSPRRLLDRDPEPEESPLLAIKKDARRRLIDALAARATDDTSLWWAGESTPGLLGVEDFPWLLERATNAGLSMSRRENYAELARMLPWYEDSRCIEAWLPVREVEPVASRFPFPLKIDLGSEEATKARKAYAGAQRLRKQRRPHSLQPPPRERVRQALELAETKDPRFFLNLCDELTLEEDSTYHRFERFLTKTPGWAAADAATRTRIGEAAKRLLTADSDEPERCRSEPLGNILPGYMPALWLLLESDPSWLEARDASWWRRWAWYVVRELRTGMIDEPNEPKVALIKKLHERAPEELRRSVVDLARATCPESRSLLTSLLEVLLADRDLDNELCDLLRADEVPHDRLGDIAKFILGRDVDRVMQACLSRIDPEESARAETAAVEMAVVLLRERTRECWGQVFEFLRRRRDLAPRILAGFAAESVWAGGSRDLLAWRSLGFAQAGQLALLLLELFPPETHPSPEGGRFLQPVDSARDLRNRLISWLGDQRHKDAVEALRKIEQQFGTKYPWLRRPRSRAERAYRLSNWGPVPPVSVAELLVARSKRLIRSGSDALDGVVEALERYGARLLHESPNDLDDFWNRPRKARPTPKEEERASDKFCMVLRSYFKDYAVAAEREVQVFRRKVPREFDGCPGSEVDVLCRVPPAATEAESPIAVPIEVKLAHNPEAKTGLRDQLVTRYMSELGTSFGVYVVVWMTAPNMPRVYRPQWGSLSEAVVDLKAQAHELARDGLDVRVVVIDVSLPAKAKVRTTSGGRKQAGEKPKSRQTRRRTAKAAKATGTKAMARGRKSAHNRDGSRRRSVKRRR